MFDFQVKEISEIKKKSLYFCEKYASHTLLIRQTLRNSTNFAYFSFSLSQSESISKNLYLYVSSSHVEFLSISLSSRDAT